MTTRMVVQDYFDRLAKRNGWESALADDVVFTSFTSPVKEVRGKQPFLESTKRFYSGIQSFKLRDLMTDGDRAVALTRYQLSGPGGASFTSDVAEVFSVTNGKITSFAIYFDSAPFPK